MSNEQRAPRASEAKVAYHLKQLLKVFSRAHDASFLQLIWAVDALQSGRERAARPYLVNYPSKAAASSSMQSQFGIHRWELETLVTQLLLAPKELPRAEGNLVLDCTTFKAILHAINKLRALENVESARYLSGSFTIWGEVHRIAQRQFHWQHGYFNIPQISRYAYLYAQGQCADFFKQTYGFEVADIMLTGFGLFTAYFSQPWVQRQTSVPEVGLTDDLVSRAFPMLSCSRDDARTETAALKEKVQREHGSPIPTALLPSILRKTPLIYVDDPNRLISPIPESIILRVTAGLYYDLIPGGQGVINDANTRFERYCIDLIATNMNRFEVSPAYQYGPKGAQQDSPDVLVRDRGKLTIAAECKATKLTYLAQFAENPFDAAKKQYTQIAKGIFQLWRFFSHVRREVIKESVASDCCAVVFTLDAFMLMARHPREEALKEAVALADEDGNIAPEDRKPVFICPIHDLETTLSAASEDSFLASLKASNEEKYHGWMLESIHRDRGAAKEFGGQRDYPFEIGDVLPWWDRIKKFAETNESR